MHLARKGMFINMKRLTSILLCIAIIFSSMLTLHAEETGFNKNLESGSVRLLEAVGILPGGDEITQSESVYVSRAEVARMLVCAVGYGDMAAKTTEIESIYKDVKAKTKYAAEIIIASQLGFFGDTLSGYFYPESLAETEWTVKAMTRLLGYTEQLKKEPYLGHRLGLLDGVEKASAKFLSREVAIKILVNALEIPLLKVTGANKSHTVYSVSENKTILTEYFGIYNKKGCLTADKYTAIKGERTEDNEVCFDGARYYIEGIETKDLVGVILKYYFKNTDNGQVIVYMEKQESEEVMLYSQKMEYSYDENCYYTEQNGKSKKLQMDLKTMVSYNGTPHFDKTKMHPLAGHVVLIDNDLDGVYEVCKIREYKNVVVKSCDVKGKRIFDMTDASRNLILDDYDEVVIYSENGEKAELSEIVPNSVLTVYESVDKSRIEIYVTSRSISRHVDRINTSKETVTIEEEEYVISDDCLFNPVDLRAGELYYFYINYWNEIVYIKENATYFALWFLNAAKDGNIDKTIEMKGVSETGEILCLELEKKVSFNTYNEKKRIDAEDAYNKLMPGNVPNKQLLKLMLNDAGKVCDIVVAYDVTSRANLIAMTKDYPLIRMSYIKNEWPDYALYRKDTSTGQKYAYFYGDNFGQWLFFDSNAIEFHVETNATVNQYKDEDMGVTKYRYSSTDQRDIATFDVYMSAKDGIAAEYIVKDLDDPREQYYLNEGYYHEQGVVVDIEKCMDEDTYDVINKLTICHRGGGISEFVTASENVIERQALIGAGAVLSANKNSIDIGDIISYGVDNEGKIKEIRLIYDSKNHIGTYPQTVMNVRVGCNYGNVIRQKNGFMEYSATGGGITSAIVLSSNIGKNLIEYDVKTKTARAITPDEVFEGERVVSISRYCSPYMVVVFREE